MKMIRRIFLDDIKSLAKNFFALVIAVGVCFLPALYAWFNIYSNWDPYGNTAGLKLAAVSMDKGYTDDNGEYHNQGETIIDNLHDNHSVDWQFVDTEEEAINGVYDGSYYAAVVVDENFSYSMYNVFTEDIEQPTLIFYENQKKNPVATKISDTVVSTLQNSINEAFIEVVISEVFQGASDVYDDVEDQGGVDGVIEDLKDLNKDLTAYESTINSIIASDELLKKNLESAKTDSQNLKNKSSSSASSIDKTNASVTDSRATLNTFKDDVNATVDDIQTNLTGIQNVLSSDSLGDDAEEMASALKQSGQNLKTIAADIAALEEVAIEGATEAAEIVDEDIKTEIEVEEDKISGDTSSGITVDQLIEILNNSSITTDSISEEDKEKAEEAVETAKTTVEEKTAEYAAAIEEYGEDSDEAKAVKEALEKAESEYSSAEEALEAAEKVVSDVTYAASLLASYTDSAETLADLAESVASINTALGSYTATETTDAMIKKLNTVQDTAANLVAQTISDVDDVSATINNKLIPQLNIVMDNLGQVLSNSSTMLVSMSESFGKMTVMFTALQSTLDSANTSLGKTNDALAYVNKRLAETIEKVEAAENEDKVEMLVSTLSGDPSRYGKFFSEPVQIETEAVYPIENYGSAVAPFYTTLAIWVGALILTAIIKVKPDKKKYPKATATEMFFGRYLLFWVMAEFQAVIIAFGDVYIFGIQCLHIGWFFFAACFTATVLSLFIYSLVITWGDVGKALSVVVLVLQIAGSSGTYPIELLPEFFQKVYIFFPFPYAINAMRECICGMFEMDYLVYLLKLGIFLIVSLVIGLLLRVPFENLNHYFEERMEDTEMM